MRELSIGNRVNVRTRDGFLMEGVFVGITDGLFALADVTWTDGNAWQPQGGTVSQIFLPTTNIAWITQRNPEDVK